MAKDKDIIEHEPGRISELLTKIIGGRTVEEMVNSPDFASGEEAHSRLDQLRAKVKAHRLSIG